MSVVYRAEEPEVRIERMVLGPVETNCYLLFCGDEVAVIDPAADGAQIAVQAGKRPSAIYATHGHGDHVGGALALANAFSPAVPFFIASPDEARAMRAGSPGNLGIPYDDDAPQPAGHLQDGDTLQVGDVELQVLEAPGHTPGGVVLLGPGFAFTGDTVFKGSVGRTDFSESDPAQMQRTLAKLVETIPPNTVILPGHGPATTWAAELSQNPYL